MSDWPNEKTALLASILVDNIDIRMETLVHIHTLNIDTESLWCEFLEEWTDGLMRRGYTMNDWYAWRTPEMKEQDVDYGALGVLFAPFREAANHLTTAHLREYNNINPHVRKAQPAPAPGKPKKKEAPPTPNQQPAQMTLFGE